MRRLFAFLFVMLFVFQYVCGQNIVGTWKGILDVGTAKLNIVFRVIDDASGKPVCKMDSPDQGVNGIPADIIFISTDSLNVAIPSLGVSYAGHLDSNSIKGVFSQAGYKFELNLSKGEYIVKRPQTPVAPFPYRTEEVTFRNKSDGAVLSGTLTYPVGYDKTVSKKTFPVILMVTGSGLQNRDEEIFDHKPFLVIADFLARNGIASLRYDDRGFGRSTGNAATATTLTFKEDARAGIDYLRSLDCFGKVGVLGHSEGASIAFMLGKEKCVDFVVSMAGAAVRGDKILVEQNRVILMFSGLAPENVNDYCNALARIYDWKNDSDKSGISMEILEDLIKENGKDLPSNLKSNLKAVMNIDNAWLNYFIKYDPSEDIKDTKCPVLAIYGSLDTQVTAKQNEPVMASLLPENKYNGVKVYYGLNHLFQHAMTGNIYEYNKIEETISHDVLQDIVAWINTLVRQ